MAISADFAKLIEVFSEQNPSLLTGRFLSWNGLLSAGVRCGSGD